MKIVFTTSGNTLFSQLDTNFGRATSFLVYDMNDNSYEVISNEKNLNAAQGAGIQSAESVVRSGAKVVITGNCGPKACRVLNSAGVKVYKSDAPTIIAALGHYRAGHLDEIQTSDTLGHQV